MRLPCANRRPVFRGASAMLAALAAFASCALGDLRIGLRLEHGDVLQFEPIRAFTTVYNVGGETMAVNEAEPAEFDLRFEVREASGRSVDRIGEAPLVKRMTIAPGGNLSLMNDVGRSHRMLGIRRYIVMVEGRWRGRRYISNRVPVNVVAGLAIADITRSLPGYGDRLRRYGLRYWRRDGHEHLFLRVDEDMHGSVMNYGVVDLGRLVRIVRPTLTVDRDGTVNVVHQSGRGQFVRSVFKSEPDRLRFADRQYQRTEGAPSADGWGSEPGGPEGDEPG